MKVALFLDLDGVLTPKAVNLQFASLMKGDIEAKLQRLENDYANGVIDNNGFNAGFIPLFKGGGFTEEFSRRTHSNIQLTPFAVELIQQNLPHTYLVTSSPSYYVIPFARRLDIPSKNIICSEYKFSESGDLLECTKPCGVADKADFVQRNKAGYSMTVGVGDSVVQDGRFLNHCNVRIMMGDNRPNYLHASDLPPIAEMIRLFHRVAKSSAWGESPVECREGIDRLGRERAFDKSVFIMTAFRDDARYRLAIKSIKDELSSHGYQGFTADQFELNVDLWANVRCYMHGCAHGIALLTADEVMIEGRLETRDGVFNANVITEAGYMMGLGKEVLVLKDQRVKLLQTDWLGKIFKQINFQDPESTTRDAVKRWLTNRIR